MATMTTPDSRKAKVAKIYDNDNETGEKLTHCWNGVLLKNARKFELKFHEFNIGNSITVGNFDELAEDMLGRITYLQMVREYTSSKVTFRKLYSGTIYRGSFSG